MLNTPLHQLFGEIDNIAVQGYDQHRQVIYWNRGSELLYGYSSDEAMGQRLEDLIIPEAMKAVVIKSVRQWLEDGIEIPTSELILRHKNGEDVCVLSSHVLFANKDNEKQMYCIDVNLAEVKHAQKQLTFRERMLEATFDAISDLFFLMKEDGTIIDYYAANQEKLYIPPKDFINKSMFDILPTPVATILKAAMAKVITHKGVECIEYELPMPAGQAHFEARISYLAEHNQLVTIVRDITDKHQTAERIRHHAYYDSLTQLPNRFLALDRLAQLINEAQRNKEKTAILFLDLDDFKKVNDTLGHEIGDKLLIECAHRLNQVVRKEDTVGRLGGDEFIVLLRGLSDDHNALIITEHLLNIFRDPFKIDGRELIVTLSIGIAIYPDNGKSCADLLRSADSAMYQAKALGRNTYSFFTDEMNAKMLRRIAIEEQIHGALERNEFDVLYQPLFSATNNEIIGAEALLYWHNTALGEITSDEFIEIAEHTGLIVPIGKYVVKQSLSFLSQWQNTDNKNYTMSINISVRQFRDSELVSYIQNTLQQVNISEEQLALEITERVLMIDQPYINDALTAITQLGIKLSMDGFGTGYSSLNYLRRFAFSVLKIDRRFIHGLSSNEADSELVKTIIAIAHSLDLIVVAEGVENQEQVTLLKALKCNYLQGCFFSKPLPATQLIALSADKNIFI